MVVRGNLISRLHARIEFNRNKFMLIDQSTNGTFVQIDGQEEAFVRRDSMQIKGEGMIGLGKVPDSRLAADDPLRLRRGLSSARGAVVRPSRRRSTSSSSAYSAAGTRSPNSCR